MKSFFLNVVALLLAAKCANADIIVSFSPSTPSPIIAGNPATIDVLVHSNASDQLDAFQVAVSLMPLTGPSAGVIFSSSQNDAQLSDSNYVFWMNSLSQETMTAVGIVNGTGDLYSGFDAAFDFVPVTLTSSDQLLFRIDLEGINAGDYQLAITDATFLQDQNGDPIDPLNQISYSASPATLSVSATAAVPEPSAGLGLMIFGTMFLWKRVWFAGTHSRNASRTVVVGFSSATKQNDICGIFEDWM